MQCFLIGTLFVLLETQNFAGKGIIIDKMSPVHIIFLGIGISVFASIPFSYFIGINLFNNTYATSAYLWAGYSFIIMIILYYVLGIRNKISKYKDKEFIFHSKNHYFILWWVTFTLVVICYIYTVLQWGHIMHPAITALKLSCLETAILRHEISVRVNWPIFNLGYFFVLPLNLIVSLFFLRNRYLAVISGILFLTMGTFVLAKGVILLPILPVLFFKMLLDSRFGFKKFFVYAFVMVLLVSPMFFMTKFATDVKSLALSLASRTLYGQISGLPAYFQLFENNKVDFRSLLPTYVKSLFGIHFPSPSRLVMEYTNPKAVQQGIAGVACTYYIGEAFAAAGKIGIICAPFIVMGWLAFCVHLFSRLKKNIYYLSIYIIFLAKICHSIFGGISYFLLSNITIMMLVFLYFILIHFLAKISCKNTSITESNK